MRAYVEKSSGGLAIIVPAPIALRIGLRDGEPAEVELEGDRLIVRSGSRPTLNDLLGQITTENLHGEWAPGPSAGVEML